MISRTASAGFARHSWRWGRRLLTGLLSLALTLLGLLLFTFMLSHLAPIDPALQIAGDHARCESIKVNNSRPNSVNASDSKPVSSLRPQRQLCRANPAEEERLIITC